jgi:hypothetical protein
MPGSVCVGFVVGKMAGFLHVLWFSPVIIISLWLSTLTYHLGDEDWGLLVASVQTHLTSPTQTKSQWLQIPNNNIFA